MSQTITETIFETVGIPEIDAQPLNDQEAQGSTIEQLQIAEIGDAQDDDVVWPSGHKLWLTMTSIFITQVLTGLDLTIVAVAIPSLTDQFSTVADIGWYTATYGLVASSMNFLMSKIYTVFPIKRVYICSLITFELGSLLCTVAPTSAAFVAGRALAGVGNSGIFTGMSMVLVQSFPNGKRPLWLGIANGIFMLSMCAAPLVGGALIDAWSWRLCFAINLPLGVVALALTWYGFHSSAENPLTELSVWERVKGLHLLGTLVLVPAIACLLLGLQWGGTKYGWSNPIIIVILVIAIVLLTVFCWLQHRRQDKAMLPPRIMKNRSILAGAWFAFCINGTLAVTEQYLSIYFQGVKGYSAVRAGILGVPLIVGLAIGAPLSGILISKIGYYSPFMLATTMLAPIGSGLLTTIQLHEGSVKVLACLGLLGFACGLGISVPVTAVQTVLEPYEIPLGVAVVGFGGGMGSSIFTCVAATLFQNRLVEEVHKTDPSLNVDWLRTVGLSHIRKYVVMPERLEAILLGYDRAVVQTMYLPLALAVLTFIGSATIEWRSVKKKSE